MWFMYNSLDCSMVFCLIHICKTDTALNNFQENIDDKLY